MVPETIAMILLASFLFCQSSMPKIIDVVKNRFGLIDMSMSCYEKEGVIKITGNVRAW